MILISRHKRKFSSPCIAIAFSTELFSVLDLPLTAGLTKLRDLCLKVT